MNILKIWDADYPWDIRVEKVSRALIENGHTVFLVCRNLAKKERYETQNGINIVRLPVFPTNFFNYFFSFPFFLNPVWLFTAIQIIRKHEIESILVRDLPMAPAGIILAKIFKITMVFDMAENYPAMLAGHWKEKRKNIINLFLRNPHFAKWLEKFVCKYSDHIIVVIEESCERINTFLRNKDKVSIVKNTPSLRFLKSLKTTDKKRDKFKMIYIGGLQKGRGIDYTLNIIPKILKKIDNFEFIVCGVNYEYNNLIKQTKDLGLENHVRFLGWIDNKEIFNVISDCDAGIIPHARSPHTDSTIPNKLFDYMIMGKPVFASNCVPIARILEEESCGIAFDPDCFDDLAEIIVNAISGNGLRQMGENGIKAIKNKFNWEKDADTLNKVFENFK